MVKCRHHRLGYGNNIESHDGNKSSMTASNQMTRETFGICETKKRRMYRRYMFTYMYRRYIFPLGHLSTSMQPWGHPGVRHLVQLICHTNLCCKRLSQEYGLRADPLGIMVFEKKLLELGEAP